MTNSRPNQTTSPEADAQAELIAAAERIGFRHGIAAVTTRALVQETGLSRSSVGYHFRGRDGVLTALYRKLTKDATSWRQDRLGAMRNAQSTFLTLPAAMAGLLTDLTTAGGPRILLMEEIEDLAMRGVVDLASDVAKDSRAMKEFWLTAAGLWGANEEDADLWRAMARGVVPTMLIETDPAIRAGEFTVFAERMLQRLARSAQKQKSTQAPIAFSLDQDGDRPEGKRLIIEAALRLIGEKGVPQLTHRQIAEAAGLSVASTTYFFKNKGEIVTAAFEELLRRILTARESTGTAPTAISQAILTENGEISWQANALLAWYLTAAREAAFKPFVRDVQTRYWGIAVAPLLNAYGITEADRIDGMLATFVVNCAIADCRLLPKKKRAAFLEAEVRRYIAALFRQN